jgi:acetolactate synthase-1/2/3 large subunit
MRKISAAEAVVDILDREGVQYVFGIPGGPILDLCDAIGRHPRIRMILTKHEQAAAYAAFGHAQATGTLGVCIATLGPGATNLLAGLPVAIVESAPVLAITGQVQISGIARGAHQESSGWFGTPDQRAMFSAVCKQSDICTEAERLPEFVRHSIRIAYAGRAGPAHLIIPSGLLRQRVRYAALPPESYRLVKHTPVDDTAAARIAMRIAKARAPVLLLGGRSLHPCCGQIAEELSRRAFAPIATDLACKSVVDERHEFYLGCLGVLGHRAAERYVKETADLIISIGQTFDEITTLSWDPAFTDGRDLIQLDTCEDEIGKSFRVADASVGNLPALLARICQHLPSLSPDLEGERHALIDRALKKDPLFSADEMTSAKIPMPPQRVIADLHAGIPDDAIILSDSSKWSRWLGRFFQARRSQIISAHDYEPMGWAVAAALGVKLAHPNRPVICVSGDGAFLMSAMELSTAVNCGAKIIWVVMNDERLGIIYDLQKTLFGGRLAATTFRNPDLVAFAKALGVNGRRVDRPGELTEAMTEAIAAEQSTLLDVRFNADEIPTLRPRSLLITKTMGLPDPTPGPETTRALLKLLKER